MTFPIALLISVAIAASGATSGQALHGCNTAEQDQDADLDGLSDVCEAELLKRFAPALIASPTACNWDPSEGRLEGGYLVGAEPTSSGVRLVYLPAYFLDCGWSGPKCLLRPLGGCDGHPGDSEAIFIDVSVGGAGADWHAERVFLSAHCFSRSDGRCQWFEATSLSWSGSHPIVWVAEGKNANYRSQRECDSGHWGYDTCDRNGRAFVFPIMSPTQDIGSGMRPFPHLSPASGCITGADLIHPGGRTGTECPWRDGNFGGWSGAEGDTATGYRRYLDEVAAFLPRGGPPGKGAESGIEP